MSDLKARGRKRLRWDNDDLIDYCSICVDFTLDVTLSRLSGQLSEQSARPILSFPVVLIVLDIGPAYQEVVLGYQDHDSDNIIYKLPNLICLELHGKECLLLRC